MIGKTQESSLRKNCWVSDMDINRVRTVYGWLINIANNPNYMTFPIAPSNIQNIKNGLIKISHDIERESPYFSQELFEMKDRMFVGYGTINPVVFGQVIEILKSLQQADNTKGMGVWDLIHPKIAAVSQNLFEDGHYANAAEDAFVEINDRVKKLFMKLNPTATKAPDGQAVMNTVFSDNAPLLEFCDRSTETGSNIQKGYMQMLAGAMSALRNPKAHANITITKDDAMRRLMFASMLMYKIDEAVKYSGIME